ncbi:PLP-dependent aminotransferase family protein [Neisseria sp. Ec49-e6-T10]|uniref:aminotransferase-like domain-containing protein n=1 Tax=Neisseria sp. Ec49-e6-T10 TaxID=3140744 RepID=UPI003EBC19C3
MWIPQLKPSTKPKYLALADAIAYAIETGELKAGDRLPPQRQLAWKLGINPSTTMLAYREATRRHLIGGETGRGTYVLDGSKEASLFLIKQPKQSNQYFDLSTNIPAIDINNQDIQQTLAYLIQAEQLNDTQGYLTTQNCTLGQIMIAKWLGLRSIQCQPSQIKLCAGAQQGLFITLSSLCKMGDPILVESFTAPGIKAAAHQLHLPLYGIAMDQDGIIPTDLDRLIRTTSAKIIVLTPSLQNPTANTMNKQRQQEIAQVILKHHIVLIEDDVYGALTQQPPLCALLPEHSILISSFSKTVAAGLRVGYIVASTNLLQHIDPEAHLSHWAVSPLDLKIISHWIENGTAKNRLDWQYKQVESRWHLARKILGKNLLKAQQPSPHIWLAVPFASPKLSDLCQQEKISVVPAEVFSVGKQHLNAIRISLTAAKNLVELKIALENIKKLIS